jgi:hypothetical protein
MHFFIDLDVHSSSFFDANTDQFTQKIDQAPCKQKGGEEDKVIKDQQYIWEQRKALQNKIRYK